MSGAAAILVALARFLARIVITVGTDGVSLFGYAQGLYGSIGSATYTDAGGNSRTIRAIIWDGTNARLSLGAAGIPNTNATFSSLVLSGPGGSVVLARSAATYDGAAVGGTQSSWLWTTSAVPGGDGHSVTLTIQ